MFPALALAVPEVTALATSLFAFIGLKKLKDNFSDSDFPTLFEVSNSVINPREMDWSDDTQSTKPIKAVFDYNDVLNPPKKDELDDLKNKIESGVDDVSVDDYVLRKLKSISNTSVDSVPDVKSFVKSEKIDLSFVKNSETLIDVLKNNNLVLSKLLGSLVNSISAVATANSVVGSQLVKEISLLREAISVLPLSLTNLSKAKGKEAEYYDYLKTPKSYDLVDEELPVLAPRDIMTLSEAVKAHLNSQEASLTADDVGIDDYDVDLNELILKLFNFKGISGDVSKLGSYYGS